MQRKQMNQLGPSNAGVSMAPTKGVQGFQEVSNVGEVGDVDSISVPLQRKYCIRILWSGALEWMEKEEAPGDQQKAIKHLPCQVLTKSKDIESELKVDTWPSKLLMQLMPKQLISNIGGQYLKNLKSVLFRLQKNEARDALTKAMVGGFAGCVKFSPMAPPQCDIKVLILLYDDDTKSYLGFIPNNQTTFVERLREVIQQQKMSQQLSGAGGRAPPAALADGGMQPNMAMGVPSMSGQQPQQHAQGMMMGGMGGQEGQVGQVQDGQTRGVSFDGLMAAMQQNLEKFQHLQQTLEVAHQNIITLHYELVLKEVHFKHQLRLLRPHLPANPGLRHHDMRHTNSDQHTPQNKKHNCRRKIIRKQYEKYD